MTGSALRASSLAASPPSSYAKRAARPSGPRISQHSRRLRRLVVDRQTRRYAARRLAATQDRFGPGFAALAATQNRLGPTGLAPALPKTFQFGGFAATNLFSVASPPHDSHKGSALRASLLHSQRRRRCAPSSHFGGLKIGKTGSALRASLLLSLSLSTSAALPPQERKDRLGPPGLVVGGFAASRSERQARPSGPRISQHFRRLRLVVVDRTDSPLRGSLPSTHRVKPDAQKWHFSTCTLNTT
ncbi:hypothetical protein L596_026167 [Steinernema carpocapsae]|uniref:Uncharacterized protein n=1 Tax=Steinernema carpocapsae TaxID=34508 RepID=A0A4U5M1J3_STECR|nr:hypothetical protein L596_026167 [Steinernema carpocapsae]